MTARRFRQHDLRSVDDLSGVWDFAFLGNADPDAVDVRHLRYTDRMAVPGCFDATPAFAGKRGLTAYHTEILLRDSTPHRLVFNSVHHWCRVYLDGTLLREHSGGFTCFAADIVGHPAGRADLVVLVDNRFDYERCPLHLDYFDWYQYGGISRPVELHRLGSLWVKALHVTTQDITTPTLRIGLAYAAEQPAQNVNLTVTFDGRVLVSENVQLDTTSGYIERTVDVPGASLWSPDAPNLHLVHAHLGTDDLRERIGIRQVRTSGQSILINDKPVRLLGFCRHEAHPEFGCALPGQVLVSDVQQLTDLGSNFVRGSHYPQDVRFLDLCDEAGICVWSESIGWQHAAQHLTDPRFISAQLTNIDEMVAMARNHPSVIMWGILNESHSPDPLCRPGYEKLLGRLRELDPTRPLTYASNHPFDDLCFDLIDVIAINTYPGWYYSEIANIPEDIDKIVAHLDSHGQAEKPFIMSEIGAAAVPGWRDWNETRWSEQYQARLLDTVIRHLFADRQRCTGLSIWQFCDCRSTEMAPRILTRARGLNNKGVLDEYRRPKQAYEVVKRWYHELTAKQQSS